jgi:hypothetical protein
MRSPILGLVLALFAVSASAETAPPAEAIPPAAKPATTEPGMVSRAASAVMKTSVAVSQSVRDEVLRMRDLFDVKLPGALGRKNLVFDFEPKAGDLVRRQFVRYPFTVRYGLTPKWEIYGGLTPISPNPFKSGEDHRWGLGLFNFGVRHDSVLNDCYFKQVSYGVENSIPLGEPPESLIDHYIHVKPYVTASRPLESLKKTTLLTSISYDRSFKSPSRDNVPPDVVKRHILEVAPGLFYKPSEFGYLAQCGVQWIDEPNGIHLAYTGKAGVLWDVPIERSKRWHLPGKWQLELAYRFTAEEGYAFESGAVARVKCKLNLGKSRDKK